MVLDGEDLGACIVFFDLLELDGEDLRQTPFTERFSKLRSVVSENPVLRISTLAVETDEKMALLARIKTENREGVVFKRRDSLYTEGKPASGGNQLKFKLYDEASVWVQSVNKKRSVAVAVFGEGGTVINVGNVTIPANAEIPSAGDVIEVRYLYAYPGGALFQPIFNKLRFDQSATDCGVSQLKYKPESEVA